MRTILLAVAFALIGCYNPDLNGPGGFTCKKEGECPSGFNCINGVCVGPQGPGTEAGVDLPTTDIGNIDLAGDGPTTDGPPKKDVGPGDLKTDQPPAATCKLVGKATDISKMDVRPAFSFAVSLKGTAVVSFGTSGTSTTLHVVTRSGTTWGTPKNIAANAGDYTAASVDTADKPIVAYHATTEDILKLWFEDQIHTIDGTKGSGTNVTIGRHASGDYRWVTYNQGATLRRAAVKVTPAGFSAQTYPVSSPSAQGASHIAQGMLVTPAKPYTLIYITKNQPKVMLSVHTSSWTHNTLETLTGLKPEEYGVGIAGTHLAGPPVVWAGYDTTAQKPVVRYGYKTQTSVVATGTNPSYGLSPFSHEAVAYLDKGSLLLTSRKTLNQGSWLKPLTLFKWTTMGTVTGAIVKGHPNSSANTGIFEVVYRTKPNLGKTSRLMHAVVNCSY